MLGSYVRVALEFTMLTRNTRWPELEAVIVDQFEYNPMVFHSLMPLVSDYILNQANRDTWQYDWPDLENFMLALINSDNPNLRQDMKLITDYKHMFKDHTWRALDQKIMRL